MARTLLLIGTRKGCFLLESDAGRRDWTMRGPLCEGWPVYHAVYDEDSGTIFAAAASEWHGTVVWRSSRPRRDLGAVERGAPLRGRAQALEGIDARRRARPPARRRRGARHLPEHRRRPHVLAPLDALRSAGQRGVGRPRRTSRRVTSASPGLITDPDDADRFWAIVQGIGLYETTDSGSSWTPRNRGLRADWPREHEEVGFCVHKLVRSPVDGNRMFQQNHVGMHRSDDGGLSWQEITEGLPTEFGFAAAVHPHDRDSFIVIPLDPGHGRTMPDGQAAVWRTNDGGSSWSRLTAGAAAARRAPRRAPPGDVGRQLRRAGLLLRHVDGPGVREHRRGRLVDGDRELPARDLVRDGGPG